MKKFGMKKVLAVFFLIAACVMPMAAQKSISQIRIGVSLPTQREERWVRDKDTMLSYAKQLGIKNIYMQLADADMNQQTQQVENLLTRGIDVLILAPHDAAAAAALVEKAHKQHVPVISYDRLIMNTTPDLYISFDNVRVGEIQGKFITELVPQGNYIILSGAPTDNNAKLFKQGAMKYIQPLIDSGKIKVVAEQSVDNWLPVNAMNIVQNALTKADNKVDAVLAPNDGTAGGVIQALTAVGLAGKVPVTGQDAEVAAAQRIVKGLQAMTVFKDTRELGRAAIDAAIVLAQGRKPVSNGTVNNNKIDVPSQLLDPYVVTKANIDEVLIKSGYMKKADVYK